MRIYRESDNWKDSHWELIVEIMEGVDGAESAESGIGLTIVWFCYLLFFEYFSGRSVYILYNFSGGFHFLYLLSCWEYVV